MIFRSINQQFQRNKKNADMKMNELQVIKGHS